MLFFFQLLSFKVICCIAIDNEYNKYLDFFFFFVIATLSETFSGIFYKGWHQSINKTKPMYNIIPNV